MSIRPIQRNLLPHTGNYYKRAGVDENQVETFETAVPMQHVRFEPQKRTALAALGEMKADKYLFFYDCRNSSPTGIIFNQMDEIEFNGNRMKIRDASPISADKAEPHHWEVYLT